MKIVCNREGLLTAFQLTASIVNQRSPKPILQNIKLEIPEGGPELAAFLLATDLEVAIRYRVSGVTIEDPGPAIFPTGKMLSILRELPDETITISSAEGGINIAGGSSKFNLPAPDPLQFPEITEFGDDPGSTIRGGVLSNMIRRTIFAIAPENSRYAMHSLLLDFSSEEPGKALLVTTDGKRLALMPGAVTLEGDPPSGYSLIPPKAMQLLQKVLIDPDEEVAVRVRDNEILFRTGKVTIQSRLVEGRFPKYQDVVPSEEKIQIRIPLSVDKFYAAVRQAKIVTSDESKGVEFTFDDNLLTLQSRATDVGESEIHMPVGYDGPTVRVTFDPQYLIDALRVLEPTEEVTLNMIDERKASVFRTGDGYAYVVMPLTKD